MKIIIVDDSLVVRKMVQLALEECREVSFIDTAPSAFVARKKIEQGDYDLIISDVNMPGENGVQLFKSLLEMGIKTPVVFFSSMSKDSINDSLDLLNLGSLDIIGKPVGLDKKEVLDYVRRKISPFLKINEERQKTIDKISIEKSEFPTIISCVAIGGSTGSPSILESLLSQIKPFNVPMIIAIHMPPQFTEGFATRLDKASPFPVSLAKEGDELQSGMCYLSDGGKSLFVKNENGKNRLSYCRTPGPGDIYPAVDVLFSSVSKIFLNRAVGIVLTGMGSDGLKGAIDIKENRGGILIQDEESSVVFGMPGSIRDAGLNDAELDINSLAQFLNSRLVSLGICG